MPKILDFFYLFHFYSENWNNLKQIPDFFELFQLTAYCFISSIYSTVWGPKNERIGGGDSIYFVFLFPVLAS